MCCNNRSIIAQDKRDYNWFLGDDQMVGPEIRALQFDFNQVPTLPSLRERGLNFDRNNVSISTASGNLLFYSNGCAIANREHDVMLNGDQINDGEFLNDIWFEFDDNCTFGYPGRQDMLILEDPAYPDGYYMIHKRLDRNSQGNFDVLNLTYSYIDMTLDDGLGAVTEKNIDFYALDRFLWSYLTAIQHKNGRDWWIINPGQDSKFYVFLLDDQGINFHSAQDVGIIFHPNNASAGGDAKFSPDGTQYAYYNQFDGLLLYDFDRRLGEFSNLRTASSLQTGFFQFGTCEWSPSSEFLYVATHDSLWQLEVAYTDLEDGKEFIEEYNGVMDPFSTEFFVSTLGPDCRIYIRPGSGSYSFHVIHKPDQKGKACRFEQQGIKLPEVSSTGSFPNFPRFRVDEEEKCDPTLLSIIGEQVWFNTDLILYPNPASSLVTIESKSTSDGDLYILDSTGRIVQKLIDIPNYYCLEVYTLSAGAYTVDYVPHDNPDRIVYTSPLVVVR
jgi:hypothetical protein